MASSSTRVYAPQDIVRGVLDPLAYWGTISRLRGFRQRQGVRVAVELDPSQGSKLLKRLTVWRAQVPPLHAAALLKDEARFVAFALPLQHLQALSRIPGVCSVMPGFIGGASGVRVRSRPSEQASTQQLRGTRAERARLVHAMRAAMAHGPAVPLQQQGPLARLRGRKAGRAAEGIQRSAGSGGPPIIGVIDFGVAFLHPALAHPAAPGQPPRTRVLKLWDQGRADGQAPAYPRPAQAAWPWTREPRMGYGRVATAATLDHLASEIFGTARPPIEPTDWRLHEACYVAAEMPELLEPSSHGTAVLGIAAAAPAAASAGAAAVADDAAAKADILFVQLPQDAVQDLSGGWLTPYLLDALSWLDAEAAALGRPLIVNLSLGSHAGSHDGQSLVERLLDDHAQRHVLVLASGNAAGRQGHAEAHIDAEQAAGLDWVMPDRDPTQSYLEIWYRAAEGTRPAGPAEVTVTHANRPAGRLAGGGAIRLEGEHGALAGALVHVPPHPGQPSGRIWMALAPTDARRSPGDADVVAPSGPWRIDVRNPGPVTIELHAWLERDEPGQTPLADRPDSVLVAPPHGAWRVTDRMTLTAQASAPGPLAVGGCVVSSGPVVAFAESGQAPTRGARQALDAWAPADERVRGLDRGLAVLGNHSGPFAAGAGGLPRARGTSLSAPHVVRRLYNLMVADPSITHSAAARQALKRSPGHTVLTAPPPP